MTSLAARGKLYRLFTIDWHHRIVSEYPAREGLGMIVGLAMAMFVALIGWGSSYFGWSDPSGKVQLALFTSFVLGGLCGYKSKG